jgi:DNA polymerase
MQESNFADHPAVQAIDAAIDALTHLREGGTKLMPVSPEVWRDFIAPPKAPSAPSAPSQEPPQATAMPPVPPPTQAKRAAKTKSTDTPEERSAAVAELSAAIQACQGCPYATEHRYVGHGAVYHPRVMVVNGACLAGDSKMAEGSRLEGEAGDLLRKMFTAIGLSDDDLYITSVMKCPVQGRPDAAAMKTCTDFLFKEINTIRPEIIVMLGDVAAKAVIPKGAAATGRVGLWHLVGANTPAIKLHHPMRILLLDDVLARPLKQENWDALKLLKARLQSAD